MHLEVRHVQEDQEVHYCQADQRYQGVLDPPWPQWDLEIRLGRQVGLEIKCNAEEDSNGYIFYVLHLELY